MGCILCALHAVYTAREGAAVTDDGKQGVAVMTAHERETHVHRGEQGEGGPCCGPRRSGTCCPGIGDGGQACPTETRVPGAATMCGGKCRYFPLFPVVLGSIFLLLGYFLSPEITRVFWMAGAGMMVVMGLFCLLFMRRMAAGRSSTRCC